MRILPMCGNFRSNYNNSIKNSNLNKASHTTFGESSYDSSDDSHYIYRPQEHYSPLRQSIENNYGRQLSQLANLADEIGMSNEQYYALRKQIEEERELELSMLKKEYL